MTVALSEHEMIKVMSELDHQQRFWDTAGATKTFTNSANALQILAAERQPRRSE